MSKNFDLDEDNCLSLDSISKAFRCGLKEEHSWALIYQSLVSLKTDLKQSEVKPFVESTNLFIKSNGTIDPKSWHSSPLKRYASIRCIVSSIGTAVYKAIDYGVGEDEEIVCSSLLEDMFDAMTRVVAADEGFEEDIEDSMQFLDELLDRCRARIRDNEDIGEHYRNVCRALVSEAIDITTFLHQISIGTQELKRVNNIDNKEVDAIQREVWIHIWMKVMRQLRDGVKLKTIDEKELLMRQQREYELTPFEMLLDDINSKRYSLKKVLSLPKEVEKDARNVILDFIRSRPPLKPAAERQLRPIPEAEPCLHEKVMSAIRTTPVLRPTPRPFERKFDSMHVQRGQRYTTTKPYLTMRPNVSEDLTTDNVFKRFSFRNLSLRSGIRIDTCSACEETVVPTLPSQRVPFWQRLRFW